MKRTDRSSAARVLNTVASLLLFLVFTVCMLIIIGTAAGTYSRITGGYERIYGSAAAIRYISNKIRAADEVQIIDDGSGIVIESNGICSVIYSRKGGLYEKSTSIDGDRSATGGDLVISVDDVLIADIGDMYEISVQQGGEASAVMLRKG
ncbi:MAG: hypothetical protein IJZ47_12280 [Oscillospiraceae bacterium]|nr:hypothetical protein [Oscillospiraceae bacterium]